MSKIPRILIMKVALADKEVSVYAIHDEYNLTFSLVDNKEEVLESVEEYEIPEEVEVQEILFAKYLARLDSYKHAQEAAATYEAEQEYLSQFKDMNSDDEDLEAFQRENDSGIPDPESLTNWEDLDAPLPPLSEAELEVMTKKDVEHYYRTGEKN